MNTLLNREIDGIKKEYAENKISAELAFEKIVNSIEKWGGNFSLEDMKFAFNCGRTSDKSFDDWVKFNFIDILMKGTPSSLKTKRSAATTTVIVNDNKKKWWQKF